MIKTVCPFCGGTNTQKTGGEDGDPFGRKPEKTVCLDCGRTLSSIGPEDKVAATKIRPSGLSAPVSLRTVCVTAADNSGKGEKMTAFFPLKDGEYPLWDLGTLVIRGDRARLGGESFALDGSGKETDLTVSVRDKRGLAKTETFRVKIAVR